jgi:uncharacterized protein (TIGR02118 family)
MIKVSVLYPATDGCTFDIDYYCNRHMPMVRQMLGEACKGVAVDHGIGGDAPASAAPYAAIGHLYFESVAVFRAAFGPCEQAIVADIPNYTNIEPLVQINDVILDVDWRPSELFLRR